MLRAGGPSECRWTLIASGIAPGQGNFDVVIYAHSSHLRSGADERGIKSLVGTEDWLAFRLQVHSTVSCKAPSSNGKARPSSIAEARWASHAEKEVEMFECCRRKMRTRLLAISSFPLRYL